MLFAKMFTRTTILTDVEPEPSPSPQIKHVSSTMVWPPAKKQEAGLLGLGDVVYVLGMGGMSMAVLKFSEIFGHLRVNVHYVLYPHR